MEPASFGLPAVGDRRVEGLRREEVAVLAVVSADYYTRLEQGRERNPSAQVVNGIAHALRLDADARTHLFRLAGLMPTPRLGAARDQVHSALLQLLDNFPTAAAYVLNPAYEILATNRIAQALLAPFGMTNMLRMMFEHPQARVIFGDWDAVVARAVRAVRLNAGTYPDDPEIKALVADLLPQSPRRHGGTRQPECRRAGTAVVTLNFVGVAYPGSRGLLPDARQPEAVCVAIGPPRQHRSRSC